MKMTMKICVVMAVGLLTSYRPALAQANNADARPPVALVGPFHSLDEYGPVTTVEDAQATYKKAIAELIKDDGKAGGGILVIPSTAPANFNPENNSQKTVLIPGAPAPST